MEIKVIAILIIAVIWLIFTLFKMTTNSYNEPYSILTYIIIILSNIAVTSIVYYYAFEQKPLHVLGFGLILCMSLYRSIKSLHIIYKTKSLTNNS